LCYGEIVSAYDSVQSAVTEYVRDYISALIRRDMSYREIAERLHCSHVWVMSIHQPETYGPKKVGADLEHRVAELVHGGSIDRLRDAALHYANGVAVANQDKSGPIELGDGPDTNSKVVVPVRSSSTPPVRRRRKSKKSS